LSTGRDASSVPDHTYFSHPSSVVYFVATCNPTPPETEIGTQKGRSRPPGPIIMMGQSETLTSSQITFTTFSSTGAHGHCRIILSQNHFLEPNRHMWTFFHLSLVCRVILSTTGDAVTDKQQVISPY
jgi:hypothetical protein